MTSLQDILGYAVKHGASDIHICVGSPPACRIDGKIRFFGDESLTPAATDTYLDQILSEKQRKEFTETGDMDVAHSIAGLGRFRVNCLMQRGSTGIIMRHVKGKILSYSELNLPDSMDMVSKTRRGLCLITGTTGSGKSTTLAAIIDDINSTRREHIITLEDPIEFLYQNKKSLVTQREISIDTHDFDTALRIHLRRGNWSPCVQYASHDKCNVDH